MRKALHYTWERIPAVMQQRPQWLLAAPDASGALKVPVTVNQNGELCPGSSTNKAGWLTFEQAVGEARQRGLGLGYVLSFDDPFTCIDLDVKNQVNAPDAPDTWTSKEDIERYAAMLYGFDTYAERSLSGQGLHLWCLGKIGKGCKRDGVEIYSQERFIACTGDVVLDRPIIDRQQFLANMATQMRATADRNVALEELEPTEPDAEVFERAANAANADKFLMLCQGRWEEMGEYPSQSEADLALMSMFTFYSRSNAQCRRLFRMTSLGKRDKAQKDDRYLNFTLSLIRARQAREDRIIAKIELSAQERTVQLALQEVERLESGGAMNERFAQPGSAPAGAPSSTGPTGGSFNLVPNAPPAAELTTATVAPPLDAHDIKELKWPPGLAGALAWFIYRNAPRPVREVAIVAAIGWLSGVCGKAFMIPGSGLNMYIILVARSAVGKEAMHTGLSVMTQTLVEAGYMAASRFIDFSDFVSGPALRKAVATNSSFLNVSGEWGRKLKRLAADGSHDGPMQSLRTEMTNLYQKSGPQSIVGGMFYSKKEDNVASINGVNYSMIGETTPGTFYEALTESMMEDGFMSRFTVVEYNGERPASNPQPMFKPDAGLIAACGQLTSQCAIMINDNQVCPVGRDADAGELMDAFDKECDEQINKTREESWRQMWNRAHLKSLRVAALLAAGDNPNQPRITLEHMQWAIDLIKRDIKIMQRKMDDGEIGSGDSTRERKILTLCKEFLGGATKGYGIRDDMVKLGIVPRKYFQVRCGSLALFSKAKQGGIRALDDTLRSLCDSGYIMEVDKLKAADSYGYQGRCYRIVNLPGGLLE